MLPAAFPKAPPPSEGKVGWRAEVTAMRGSKGKQTQQIKVCGAWFSLTDTERILPTEQCDEDEEEDGEEEEEEEGEEEWEQGGGGGGGEQR